MRCAFVPLDRATCKPLTIVPALQAAMAALDKASRLAHADRKRNLSDHRSASPLANFLVKGNSLDFAHKKSKVLMSVGSPAFHNKGGRPKHRPWCNFMAIEVAASLRFKPGARPKTQAPGISMTRARQTRAGRSPGPLVVCTR